MKKKKTTRIRKNKNTYAFYSSDLKFSITIESGSPNERRLEIKPDQTWTKLYYKKIYMYGKNEISYDDMERIRNKEMRIKFQILQEMMEENSFKKPEKSCRNSIFFELPIGEKFIKLDLAPGVLVILSETANKKLVKYEKDLIGLGDDMENDVPCECCFGTYHVVYCSDTGKFTCKPCCKNCGMENCKEREM